MGCGMASFVRTQKFGRRFIVQHTPLSKIGVTTAVHKEPRKQDPENRAPNVEDEILADSDETVGVQMASDQPELGVHVLDG